MIAREIPLWGLASYSRCQPVKEKVAILTVKAPLEYWEKASSERFSFLRNGNCVAICLKLPPDLDPRGKNSKPWKTSSSGGDQWDFWSKIIRPTDMEYISKNVVFVSARLFGKGMMYRLNK